MKTNAPTCILTLASHLAVSSALGPAALGQGILPPVERTITNSQNREATFTLLAADETSIYARGAGRDFIIPMANVSHADQEFVNRWMASARSAPVVVERKPDPEFETDRFAPFAEQWRQAIEDASLSEIAGFLESGNRALALRFIEYGIAPWIVRAIEDGVVKCAPGGILHIGIGTMFTDARSGRYTVNDPKLSLPWELIFVMPDQNDFDKGRTLAAVRKALPGPTSSSGFQIIMNSQVFDVDRWNSPTPSISFPLFCAILVRIPAEATPGNSAIEASARVTAPDGSYWIPPINQEIDLLPTLHPDREALLSFWAYTVANKDSRSQIDREKSRVATKLLKLFSLQLKDEDDQKLAASLWESASEHSRE